MWNKKAERNASIIILVVICFVLVVQARQSRGMMGSNTIGANWIIGSNWIIGQNFLSHTTIQKQSNTLYLVILARGGNNTNGPPTYPASINTDAIWQYLNNWDFVGFIVACWTWSLGESFYVLLSIAVVAGIYIRTKNLTLMTAMWFIFGSAFLVLIPAASPVIWLLIIFGVAGALFKIVQWIS